MSFWTDHAGDGQVRKHRLYYLGLLTPQITVAAAVSSGSQTVTPPSMAGISIGTILTVMDNDAPALGDTISGALAGAGAGNVDNGAHSWLIVVNRTGGIHTAPGAVSPAVTVVDKTTNGKVSLTRTGGALPTGYTWDVYRTAAGADPTIPANFKLVNASPIAAGTTTYTDNIADASLGVVAPTASTGGANAELVTVTGISGTTFTATFILAHYPNWLLGVPNPLYWTDCDIPIVWSGQTWVPQSITVEAINAQPTGNVTAFKIGDAANVWFPILAACNGGELAIATIYEAGFLLTNLSAVPDAVQTIYTGRVDHTTASTVNEDNIEITLMPPTVTTAGSLPVRLISTLLRT